MTTWSQIGCYKDKFIRLHPCSGSAVKAPDDKSCTSRIIFSACYVLYTINDVWTSWSTRLRRLFISLLHMSHQWPSSPAVPHCRSNLELLLVNIKTKDEIMVLLSKRSLVSFLPSWHLSNDASFFDHYSFQHTAPYITVAFQRRRFLSDVPWPIHCCKMKWTERYGHHMAIVTLIRRDTIIEKDHLRISIASIGELPVHR